MRRRNESLIAAALADYSAGQTGAEVCHEYGISMTTLRRYLAEAGITPRPERGAVSVQQQPRNITPPPYARGYRYWNTSW